MGFAVSKCHSLDISSTSAHPLLHGTLKIDARQAKDLPDTDNLLFNLVRGDLTDTYLEVCLGTASLAKTAVIRNSLSPVWNEEFSVAVCHHSPVITIKVRISLIIELQHSIF